jgi:hypothetical protein
MEVTEATLAQRRAAAAYTVGLDVMASWNDDRLAEH